MAQNKQNMSRPSLATDIINPEEMYTLIIDEKNNKTSSRDVIGSRIIEIREKLEIELFINTLTHLIRPGAREHYTNDATIILARCAMGAITIAVARKKLAAILRPIYAATQVPGAFPASITMQNLVTKEIITHPTEVDRTTGEILFCGRDMSKEVANSTRFKVISVNYD
ncbi:hypothetical protein BST79_gp345 [Only Syngen Nebraska virus 5]|uniref:hypothetical protein n=1 Tax=Only Syngen Nebraska virus 5 TaxID=1917232 RepID=UPI000901D3C1|nr:hypothetical protein BST79_gp345 [Only Syngen Nebraska virus 5]APC25858.1 hypothetical protein [Only Syngen Nebraska virus 5]